jgi:molybdate transport system substrate-binding protein
VAIGDVLVDVDAYCPGGRQIVKASPQYKSVDSVGREGLTVSRKAPSGAANFVMYLLSPQGQAP